MNRKIVIPSLVDRLNDKYKSYIWFQDNCELLLNNGISIEYYIQGDVENLPNFNKSEITYIYAPLAGSAKIARRNYLREHIDDAVYLFVDDDVTPYSVEGVISIFDDAEKNKALVGGVLFDNNENSTAYYFFRYCVSLFVQIGKFRDVRLKSLLLFKIKNKQLMPSDRVWGGMFCCNRKIAELYSLGADYDQIDSPNYDIRFSILLKSLGIDTFINTAVGCVHQHVSYIPLGYKARIQHHKTLKWYYGGFSFYWSTFIYKILDIK